uniref:Lipase n=1 Tax=Panagrolaimus sp. PS1159 TaxID=55785 RepID=A0AC35GND9_9BILA
MKVYVPLVFALFFNVVECFYVPEDWLAKHGYNVRKKAAPHYPYGWHPRSFNGKNRMNKKSDIPVGPFTDDFSQWLESTDYADYNFPFLHLGINASYGGKEYKEQSLKHNPVVFIHGNSDGALDAGTEFSSGFSASIKYFLSKGYTSAELYAVTWGDRQLDKSFTRKHTCPSLTRVRKFVEAVMDYTKAEKIDIIAHSMGVTFARQIIKGGLVYDPTGVCDLGKPINSKVKSFLGIAAANYGLCMCNDETSESMPVCGKILGFYSGSECKNGKRDPDITCASARPEDECDPDTSVFLSHLNGKVPDKYGPLIKDADEVYSFYSEEDEIVGPNFVFGRKTSVIPFSSGVIVFPNMKHHQLKTDTVVEQYNAIALGFV